MKEPDNTPYTAEAWQDLKERFANSPMREIPLAELGKNVGLPWPFKETDETPDKYLGYDLEELGHIPGLIGKKQRVRRLMDILRETLAFDEPFSEMMDTVEAESEHDQTFEKILGKLGIPETYPTRIMHFSESEMRHIRSAELETLGDFVRYARSHLKGDDELMTLVNALSHRDERRIASYLPYRMGSRGVHFPEALALTVGGLSDGAALELLRRAGMELREEERKRAPADGNLRFEAELKAALDYMESLVRWFQKEAGELKTRLKEEDEPERYFVPLHDPYHERLALALARVHFRCPAPATGGFLRGITRFLGR